MWEAQATDVLLDRGGDVSSGYWPDVPIISNGSSNVGRKCHRLPRRRGLNRVHARRGRSALGDAAGYGSDDVRAFQNRLGTAGATAIRTNGISRVVNLSSIGSASSDSGVGPISGLHDVEGLG